MRLFANLLSRPLSAAQFRPGLEDSRWGPGDSRGAEAGAKGRLSWLLAEGQGGGALPQARHCVLLPLVCPDLESGYERGQGRLDLLH